MGTRLRTLRGLAGYRCGHTGSCCRAGWPIPVEAAPLAVLHRAAAGGRLPPTPDPWLVDDRILGHTQDNDCSFLDRTALAASRGGCRIEQTLGTEGLPFSCRQFPRVLLADGRGWHATLSAWCGTAAALLTAPVDNSESFLAYDHIDVDHRVHVEFLDARGAWPPFLRPGVLAGLAAYDAWEARVLEQFLAPVGCRTHRMTEALWALLQWTEWVRGWSSHDGDLTVRVLRPWAARTGHVVHIVNAVTTLDVLLQDLISRVPAEWRPAAWPEGLTDTQAKGGPLNRNHADEVLARYMATRLVGSWVAYQGQGLRSVLASLIVSHALVVRALSAAGQPVTLGRMTSAIRAADWLSLHLLDRDVWAAYCSSFEGTDGATRLASLVRAAGTAADGLQWSLEP